MSTQLPLPAYIRNSETSKAAAARMRNKAPSLREKILTALREKSRTCDEIEVALGLAHQTASARIRELAKDRKIRPIGKAKTRSGCEANVWEAV